LGEKGAERRRPAQTRLSGGGGNVRVSPTRRTTNFPFGRAEQEERKERKKSLSWQKKNPKKQTPKPNRCRRQEGAGKREVGDFLLQKEEKREKTEAEEGKVAGSPWKGGKAARESRPRPSYYYGRYPKRKRKSEMREGEQFHRTRLGGRLPKAERGKNFLAEKGGKWAARDLRKGTFDTRARKGRRPFFLKKGMLRWTGKRSEAGGRTRGKEGILGAAGKDFSKMKEKCVDKIQRLELSNSTWSCRGGGTIVYNQPGLNLFRKKKKGKTLNKKREGRNLSVSRGRGVVTRASKKGKRASLWKEIGGGGGGKRMFLQGHGKAGKG